MTFSPYQTDHQIQDIYLGLSRCRAGRRLLRDFQLVSEKISISVEAYPEALSQRLREAGEEDSPNVLLAAAVVWGPKTVQLFFDAQAQLGTLIAYVAHEMAHCLDHLLVKQLAQLSPDDPQRQHLQFTLERRAFDKQFEILSEMKIAWPELTEFLSTEYPHVWTLSRCPTDEEIRQRYRLAA